MGRRIFGLVFFIVTSAMEWSGGNVRAMTSVKETADVAMGNGK